MTSDKIIVALDYDDPASALALVYQIKSYITFFKVGSQLYTRSGPEFVRYLRSLGLQVFLDLKFHDIPATVAHSVKEAIKLDVQLLTIHTSGGSAMMKEAVQAATGSNVTVLGVTVLTSMDDDSLRELNIQSTVNAQVLHLARLARRSGVRGLVCSPLELPILRGELGPDFLLVTPGIRGAAAGRQDQKRTLSALEALKLGASHLVVGRPITQASDALDAAKALLNEIASIS